MLGLLQAVLRRTSYLALLDEQPSALARLVDVLARSALLAERLAAYPLLLDELLDVRVSDRCPMRPACGRVPQVLAVEDLESALRWLNETRLALSFRMAMATLDGRQGAVDSTRQLAELAQAVVTTVLAMAEADMRAAHGVIPGGASRSSATAASEGLSWASVPTWTWYSCTTIRPAWRPAMAHVRWNRGAGMRGWRRR